MSGQDTRMSDELFRNIYRNVFMTLWNTYKFFETYTKIDKWQPLADLKEPKSPNILDQWIITRLNQTIEEVTIQADRYKLSHATRPISELIDDLSNWYVRRSRRRFWKSENDQDKELAYETLHFTLIKTCQLLAPWAPFLSDHIYKAINRSKTAENSVHLTDWPKSQQFNPELLEEMQQIRSYIAEGLAQRAKAGIKVRQPLLSVTLPKYTKAYSDIIIEELNVKRIIEKNNSTVVMDTTVTETIRIEGLMRELVRRIQNTRKNAGLNVEDRINLAINSSDPKIITALKKHRSVIMSETLAETLNSSGNYQFSEQVQIDGKDVNISISKT